MRAHRILGTLILLFGACGTAPDDPCGDLIEDRVLGRCICPPDTIQSDDGWSCLLPDGGVVIDPNAPDGSTPTFDAGPSDAAGPDSGPPDSGTVGDGGCASDADCDDADACNGRERCAAGTCVTSAALDCDDGDNCTEDSCDASAGCQNTLIDADGDGFAPASLGTCTTRPSASRDCDDDDESRYPGAAELCNGRDEDCDDAIDESGTDLECFRDADGDGYPNPAIRVLGCTCPTGYIVARADELTDCADTVPEANPGQTEYRTVGYMRGGSVSFDWNCDGVETDLLDNRVGAPTCATNPPGSGVCRPYDPAWVALPACANEGTVATCMSGILRCDPSTVTYTRGCR